MSAAVHNLAAAQAQRRRPRLGIVIQHYDARNDVRELVALLAREHDVVLFGAAHKLAPVDCRWEKRAFRQRPRVPHRLWQQLFNLFGELPASRDNYLVTELFKLAALPPARRRLATLRLRLRLLLPTLVSFDALLDHLRGLDTTPVADIDRFLIITELSSPAFLARVLAAGIPADAYVYSWDHACKHASFSRRIRRWLVWHAGIAEDLTRLQGIPAERIEVVGATQLAYIHEYLGHPALRQRRLDRRYVYYGCGVGHAGMARQEAAVIGLVADALAAVAPDVLLLVRPYPMLADIDCFRALRTRPNVRFDEDYRHGRKDRSLTREDIFRRLCLQEHAAAFLHCGTTMGLEGAYLGAPVLFLDLQDAPNLLPRAHPLSLHRFVHQYQNERYMQLPGYPNVITRTADLGPRLAALLANPAPFRAYGAALAAPMRLSSLGEVAERLAPATGAMGVGRLDSVRAVG